MDVLRVAGAQLENVVGDLQGNARRIADAMAWAEEHEADVLLLPELALTGYPLADLVLRRDFVDEAVEALSALAARSGRTATVVGAVARVPPRRAWDTRQRDVAVAAAVLCDGEVRGDYHKVLLPTYEVFEEARNFAPGERPHALWRIGEAVAGISICEDLWSGDGPPEAQAAAGAQVLLVPNASPWHREKPAGRYRLVATVARRNGVPVVYVNCVGGQDELVFDGGSLVVDGGGGLLYRAAQFRPERFCLDVPLAPARTLRVRPTTVHARPPVRRAPAPASPPARQAPQVDQAWEALVVGTRDFVAKNGLGGAVLGLSGGIDSSVAAAVAADALGPGKVLGVAMPAREETGVELSDSRELARNLGLRFEVIPLPRALAALGGLLSPILGADGPGSAEALEARARAALLSALAHELGYLSLATGNKSELSIGSATLYGDLAGGFAPLKDCPKTLVYRLARHRNEVGPAIPERILERPPTAQASDRNVLPPYEVLDEVVERYVERGEGLEDIVAAGLDPEVARGVLQLVDDAELKRRQTPPGVKITAGAFGQDLRMPIANRWRPFEREEAELVGEDDAAALQMADVAILPPRDADPAEKRPAAPSGATPE